MDVFDLTQTPSKIAPELAFEGLFLAVGLGLFAVAIIILRSTRPATGGPFDRPRRLAWFALPFSLFWTGFTLLMSLEDIWHSCLVRSDTTQGQYSTLQGCLEYFHPGLADPGKSTAGNERWAVAGHTFSYGDNELSFAYHAVEPRGGIIHADTWVKVSFVPDGFAGRDDIIRLVGKRHVCPSAPDVQ